MQSAGSELMKGKAAAEAALSDAKARLESARSTVNVASAAFDAAKAKVCHTSEASHILLSGAQLKGVHVNPPRLSRITC